MPNAEKVEKVHALAERFRAAQGTLFSDYRGLTVKDAMELRATLRAQNASFVIAKNTLTKLAAKEAGIEGVDDLLQGPTGIVFADGDPIAGAKAFAEVARRFPALILKGAYVEGHVFDEEGAKGLSTVEAREVSLAKVAGLLQAPLSRIAYLLQAPLQRLAYALAERGKQEGSAPAEAKPDATEASADAPAETDGGAPSAAEEPTVTVEAAETPEPDEEPAAPEASEAEAHEAAAPEVAEAVAPEAEAPANEPDASADTE
jgi:large subunit ribosomal protein L10